MATIAETVALEMDELAKYKHVDLTKRYDDDWHMARGDKYIKPSSDGTWKSQTSNRFHVETRLIEDYLANGKRRLFIETEQSDDKEARKKVGKGERLAIGFLRWADELAADDPNGAHLQGLDAFYTTHRGRILTFAFLKDDPDNEGQCIPVVEDWDPRNAVWSKTKITRWWWCSPVDVKEEYPEWEGPSTRVLADSTNPGNVDTVCLFEIWTAPSGKGNNKVKGQHAVHDGVEWLLEPEDYDLNRMPVKTLAVGGTPLIQEDNGEDNSTYVGESYIAPNRSMWEAESEMLTLQMTAASFEAKPTPIIHYDSNFNPTPDNPMSKNASSDPKGPTYAAGSTIMFDKAAGMEFKGFVPPPATGITNAVSGRLELMANKGGLSPAAYGEANSGIPAIGIEMLYSATLNKVLPGKKCIEEIYIWRANEILRQFKAGGFKAMTVEGRDNYSNYFRTEIKADEIDDSWHFGCTITPQVLRDKAMMLSIAKDAKKEKLMSRRAAMEFLEIEDVEAMMDAIDLEEAEELLDVKPMKLIEALIKDGDKVGAMAAFNRLQAMRAQRQPGQAGGAPNSPGIPSAIPSVAATAGMVAANTPENINENVRLASMNLVRGR